jgi:hypothetical protein
MLIAQEWLFEGKKKRRFNEIDVSVVKSITEMHLQGFPVTREAIQIKGQEIARSLNISEDQFKGSMGWCKKNDAPEWSGFKVKKLNTNLVIIPGDMTSQLQVLDVVVNMPFKDHLKRQYSNWLRGTNHAYTPAGRMKTNCLSVT